MLRVSQILTLSSVTFTGNCYNHVHHKCTVRPDYARLFAQATLRSTPILETPKTDTLLSQSQEKKKAARPGHNKNNPKAATAAAVEAAAVADVGMSVSVSEDEEWQETVTERFQAVRACTAGDAAEEMEQLGNTFYAFKNIAQNGEVCVVYKRSDGGYGVVVPVDMD